MPARQLQRALHRWRRAHGVDSVAVAVKVGDRVWVGGSTAKRASAIHPGERYGIASLTKTFTAALVLQAADLGLLDLDAAVPRVPGLPRIRSKADITPRQLLQHTSGLADYKDVPGYDAERELGPEQAVALALRAPLEARPGGEVRYSNTNYLYLGLVLEHVTGKPYAELVDHVAASVGLPGVVVHPGASPGWVGHASGGVHATLTELVSWTDALFTPGRVVSAERVSELSTLDQHNLGLATWPLCPCWTDRDGTRRASAIGHHVGSGGMYRNPAGFAFAARIEPVSAQMGEQMESLHLLLAEVLRR